MDSRSLIAVSDLDRGRLGALFDEAEAFLAPDAATAHRGWLAGRAVALLFYEPSTRTRLSFQLAACRLGADVVSLDENLSSGVKGETLGDTLATLAAMDVHFFVVRHRDNGIMAELAANLPSGCALVSAGEGSLEHPTQGLLDAFTIRRHRPRLAGLRVAIVGDIAHSRVARSSAQALALLGVEDIRLVGPRQFLPRPGELPGELTSRLEQGLTGADVVIALRVQRERLEDGEGFDPVHYRQAYGLSVERLEEWARPDCLLLHPGPVNWGTELAPEFASWPRSLIREQVRNGVAVRMAVLARLEEVLRGRP